MKKLIFTAMLLATIMLSCGKKAAVTPTQTTSYNVVFGFNADGNSSLASLTNEQTGVVQSNPVLTSSLNFTTSVKVGEKVLVELRGNVDGADSRYNVAVSYNGKQIAMHQSDGIAGIHQQDIKFEMTFTAANFQ